MFSIIDDLILLNYIDSGCFAEIYYSKKKDSDIPLATKKISMKYISVEPLFKTSLQNEINFLKEFDHPNIIKLYDVKLKPDNIYLVMEYCNGGSLKKALNNYKMTYGKPFSEEIVKYLMRQILSAVDYLHSKGIVHRDLKLDNILLKYNTDDASNFNIMESEIKIIDFNISTRSKKIVKERDLILNDDYNDNNFNEKIDIWYLGLLCYEMLFGEKIFGEGNNKIHINSDLFVIIPQSISLDAQTFLLSMLQTNTNKRLSAKELLNHDFIKKNPVANPVLNPVVNPVVNPVLDINIENTPNKLSNSFIPKKLEEKTLNLNLNLNNTPMNKLKYKTIVPEDRLRQSARISRTNHRKYQTMVDDSDIMNLNNKISNSNSHNNIKTEPMIGPQLKKGENKIKNIKNIKNFNLNYINNKIYTKKSLNINNQQHICKVNVVGKNINRNQLKTIIDCCIKACLQMKGKIMTATKAAKDIKNSIGDNWLVFISNVQSKNYDFCVSSGNKDNYTSFNFDDKLFQVLRYN